jgi:hypothetical protein
MGCRPQPTPCLQALNTTSEVRVVLSRTRSEGPPIKPWEDHTHERGTNGEGRGLDAAVGVLGEALAGGAVHRAVAGPGPAAEAGPLVVEKACWISARVFITKGPCWTTGSPIGRPCSSSSSRSSAAPLTSAAAASSARGDRGVPRRRRPSPGDRRALPRKQYSVRLVPRAPAAASKRAPGSSVIGSRSRRRCRGGGPRVGRRRRGRSRPSWPAITVTSVLATRASSTHDVPRDLSRHRHREVGLDHLVDRREVEPDLEELDGVGATPLDQREHLRVHDAAPRGQPLRVAAAERAVAPSESE